MAKKTSARIASCAGQLVIPAESAFLLDYAAKAA
jgi:hypothetical protein